MSPAHTWQKVLNTYNGPALILFSSKTCAHCPKAEAVFRKLSIRNIPVYISYDPCLDKVNFKVEGYPELFYCVIKDKKVAFSKVYPGAMCLNDVFAFVSKMYQENPCLTKGQDAYIKPLTIASCGIQSVSSNAPQPAAFNQKQVCC